jgi:hypothetical protein
MATGPPLGMRYQIPAMLRTGGGAIVNMASVAGLHGVANLAGYVAGKTGIIGLSKVAALDYADQGVRVNVVAPGPILTHHLEAAGEEAQRLAGLSTPMRRVGQAQEVAAAVVWLCSDQASFITGVTLPIDGGQYAGLKPNHRRCTVRVGRWSGPAPDEADRWSGVAEVAAVVVVDRPGAGRAVPAGFQRGAAGDVAQALGVGGAGPVGAPLGQEAEGTGQLAAGRGQLVGEAGRPAGVGLADQDQLPLQVLEALGQHVGGDAGKGLQQLVEPARPGQQGLDQQQRPAVADAGDGFVER